MSDFKIVFTDGDDKPIEIPFNSEDSFEPPSIICDDYEEVKKIINLGVRNKNARDKKLFGIKEK